MKFLSKHWPLFLTLAVFAVPAGFYVNAAYSQVPPTRDAKMTWGAVTTATDGSTITGVTYNLYQGAKGSTSKTQIRTGLTGLIATVTGLPAGEVCFELSAQTALNGEGGHSNEGCKSFPASSPSVPVLTVQ